MPSRPRLAGTALLAAVLVARSAYAQEPAPHVAASRVRPIKRTTWGTNAPLLAVWVVDEDAVPIPGAVIVLTDTRGHRFDHGRTGKDGSALLKMPAPGRYRVRASAETYLPSAASDVLVQTNGLTALALPLAAESTEGGTR